MTLMKSACLTLAFAGCVALSYAAHAGVVTMPHIVRASAPSHCQAFTPGPANTIRNRVVGSENVGTATMNVACTFEETGSFNMSLPEFVSLHFSNNGVAPITVSCTLLTGSQGWSGAIMVNKSVIVNPGAQSNMSFTPDDTADQSDQNLGSHLVGVNCSLPPRGVINDTYMVWDDEDDT